MQKTKSVSKVKLPEELKKKPVKRIEEIKPKEVRVSDFRIKIEEGEFAETCVIFRCSVTDGVKEIKSFNAATIYPGFGATSKEAQDDFIRRNSSDVLDKVFYD